MNAYIHTRHHNKSIASNYAPATEVIRDSPRNAELGCYSSTAVGGEHETGYLEKEPPDSVLTAAASFWDFMLPHNKNHISK